MSSALTVPRSEPAVELRDVSVRYRLALDHTKSLKEYLVRRLLRGRQIETFSALEQVTLTVHPGQVLGITGHNGAGKSTLLKVVARVIRPSSGRVIIRGRVAPLLELGAGFDLELTGRENVFLNGGMLGFTRSEMAGKYNRIVEFADLGGFIDAPMRTYSSGMVARLGFAVATDSVPEILLLDEILSVGDEQFRAKCAERIDAFRRRGTTILLVSHSAETIRALCGEMIVVNKGRIQAVGSPGEVLRPPVPTIG